LKFVKIENKTNDKDFYDESEREEMKRVVYLKIACFLLEYGKASLFIKNSKNEAPLDYLTFSKKQKNVQQNIMDHEANSNLSVFLVNYYNFLSNSSTIDSQIEKVNLKIEDLSNSKNSIARQTSKKQPDLKVFAKNNV